jgi:polyphosphate glucokinase
MAATGARRRATKGFGVDIGGSGIKGCPVDLAKGAFDGERLRFPTPEESTPDNVVEVVVQVVESFDWKEPFGCTFPGVVQHGVVRTAANVDKSWIGVDLRELLAKATGLEVTAVNDADAAGVAEVRFGAAKEADGTVVLTTLGTGIGTALLDGGHLVPNTELGHVELDGVDAETRAADSAREREDLSWKQWAKRLQRYYSYLEMLLWPDLFVVGGGVSKKADKFLPLLDIRTPIVPAGLRNDGGIVGAAMLAAEQHASTGRRTSAKA